MKKNNYWEEMIDDIMTVLLKTYGIMCGTLVIIAIFLKIFGYL